MFGVGEYDDCPHLTISVQQIAAIIPHKGANLKLETSCLETIAKVNVFGFYRKLCHSRQLV